MFPSDSKLQNKLAVPCTPNSFYRSPVRLKKQTKVS